MKQFLIKILAILLLTSVTIAIKAADNDSVKNATIIKRVEKWYTENINYGNITFLMIVESSFIPFPSEVVIPPAAYIASKPESKLNIFLVVLFGTIGALIGAYINYFLAAWLGRPVIYKLADSRVGRLFLLSKDKIIKAEQYFNKHGKISTIIGRLIPGIRQLISIPAGLSKMNFASFTIYTVIGAFIWNMILAAIGYLAHGQSDLIDKYSHELSIVTLVILGIAIIILVIRKIIKIKK